MTNLFTGLSAFPLTPLRGDALDEESFVGLIDRLTTAGVDSITVLGSTGSYAYLNSAERARVADLAVECAAGTPVLVGIGALRTSDVLTHADGAETAGASGLLLAPMTYQPLTDDDVFELFRTVSEHTTLPVVLYDNPVGTRFTFTTELYGRIAELPGIASIKIPGAPVGAGDIHQRVAAIRDVVPAHVSIGISGDPHAAAALSAGCDVWYSVIGGTLPDPALRITRAALSGRASDAAADSAKLAPLWDLFAEFGGLRVIAAVAEALGLVSHGCLPLPIQGLNTAQRSQVAATLVQLELT